MDDNLIKIYFKLDPNDWHAGDNERLWAEPVPGAKPGTAFRLRNSPFYARGVSFLDIVAVVPRADGGPGPQFAGVIERSGHSTYWLLVPPERSDFGQYWNKLQNLGCTYESTTKRFSIGSRTLYSVDVPAHADINAVRAILEEGQRAGVWIFHEAHCGHELKG